MAFYQSAGVYVKEIDLTGIVPGTALTTGAFCGPFAWGPVNHPVLLNNEEQLLTTFGRPNDDTAQSFFTVANFLGYSQSAYVVRCGTETLVNAFDTEDGILPDVKIDNDEMFDEQFNTAALQDTMVIARYPGSLGNGLRLSMADKSSFSRTLTGTVSTTLGSATVTGSVAASFTTELIPGSIVKFESGMATYTLVVSSITSDTEFVATSTATVAVTDVAATATWEYASVFGYAPDTTDFTLSRGAADDEMHVVIIDTLGAFGGARGDILEVYTGVSKASGSKKFDGSSNYYLDVINRNSRYVRVANHPSSAFGVSVNTTDRTAFGVDTTVAATTTGYALLNSPATRTLSGGVDGYDLITEGERRIGYDLFANDEQYDLSLIMLGLASASFANYVISNVAEQRQDAVVFVSPNYLDNPIIGSSSREVDRVLAYRDELVSSSFAVMDTGAKYQYDKYNDTFRWTYLNGDIAGTCARTDLVRDPWFSPGGFNRGRISNVAKLAFSPNKGQRDVLYTNGVNPVVMFPGEGPILYGDKTAQKKPSAFDRINVRRLFITLRRTISTAAKYQLFELNDEFTRAQFRAMVEPFLRDIQARRGIQAFRVVCDETNNTDEVVMRNEFKANIMIKPTYSINFIELSFFAVRGNVSFEEVAGA